MPRYFFDHRDSEGDQFMADDTGLDLPNVDAAELAAARSLTEHAKDVLPGSANRTLAVEVSDGDGPILETRLAFEVVSLRG